MQYVVLKSLDTGDVFWTSNPTGRNPERMGDGSIGYEVLAYTETPEEAKEIWLNHNPLFRKFVEGS